MSAHSIAMFGHAVKQTFNNAKADVYFNEMDFEYVYVITFSNGARVSGNDKVDVFRNALDYSKVTERLTGKRL